MDGGSYSGRIASGLMVHSVWQTVFIRSEFSGKLLSVRSTSERRL